MKGLAVIRAAIVAALLAVLLTASAVPLSSVAAQSGRQPEKKKVEKKIDEKKGSEQPQEPVPPVPKDIKQEPPIKLSTQVVNIDVTVVDKKSGRLYTNLTRKNFTTPLGKDKLLLAKFTGSEAISQLFRFELKMFAENATDIAFDKLLGQSVVFGINGEDGSRQGRGGRRARQRPSRARPSKIDRGGADQVAGPRGGDL